MALLVTGALGWFWAERGHLSEGRRHLEAALGRPDAPRQGAARARVANELGILARLMGDGAASAAAHQESLALYRYCGDRRGEVVAIENLAILAFEQQQYDAASAYFESAREVAHGLDDPALECTLLNNQAGVALSQARYDEASALLAEGLALASSQRLVACRATILANLGLVACRCGQPELALAQLRESLGLLHEIAARAAYPEVIEGLAALLVEHHVEVGVKLLGAASAMREELAMPLSDQARHDLQRASEQAHAALGAGAYCALLAAGAQLTIEEACALAGVAVRDESA
jgi:tetratricopeptide (TPR) repeat protein